MSRRVSKDLLRFLKPYPLKVRQTTLELRKFVLDLYPDCFELIYDNYNAVAVGFAVSERAGDVFCSIAVYSSYVNFGLNRGSELSDPQKKFVGSGSLYRRMTVGKMGGFRKSYAKRMLKSAHDNAVRRLKHKSLVADGVTITKSISPVKRRPKQI